MRIVISSKYLASQLKVVNLETAFVAKITDNKLILFFETGTIDININSCSNSMGGDFMQQNKRWDWLYDIVSKIEDIPIVLDINQNKLNLIIEF
jgi:hypothetical protein